MSLATRIAQEFNNVRSHISGITATHLLDGNLSVSNEVITNGFSTTLYTGNGGTKSINTGIDMSTQWGDDASEMFGGLVWLKSRSAATNHYFVDTVRGATKDIYSNATTAETTEATGLTSFNSTGFNLGTLAGMNTNLATYTSWNFQTTHRRTGVTNHGKAYTEHYNPFTGFTIIKYEGSGIAGHEIPHSLGRKLDFVVIKNLSAVRWQSFIDSHYMFLNETIAGTSPNNTLLLNNTISTLQYVSNETNASTNQYIMYGWANSYFDETNKLIGNYEVDFYQGTGVAGNKVTTRGKPAWVMIKRSDVADNWLLFDNQRNTSNPYQLYINTSAVENTTVPFISFVSDGFILQNTVADKNASGGQYLYMVVYDNDSGSGKSKYPKATDTSNVQINNAIIPLAHGVDSNGSKNSIVIANETITGLTYTQGKNYLYKTDTGYGVKPYEPRYLSSELVRRFAGEQPDYYDVESNKWFNTDTGSELVVNGTFSSGVTTGWTAQDGAILSIDNGTLKVLNGVANAGSAYQLITGLTIGKRYKFKAQDVGGNNNYSSVYINFNSSSITNAILIGSSFATLATFSADTEFIAQATSMYIVLRNEIVTINLYNNFDNISVFPVDITPTTEITESRNYLNHIVHADQNGQVTYVEELPKIEYKDIIKANEYQGKNACTALFLIDGTVTPPLIKNDYNLSNAIRTATGVFDIYFKTEMNTVDYTVSINYTIAGANTISPAYFKYKNKLTIYTYSSNSVLTNANSIDVHIFGGKS